ncbi:AIFM3 factor, partial [Dromaius novaehollandiae]|nr:AIFM3 factor [Dromaius novaehollandiae]
VLLVRNRTRFSALGSRCPHYGAPLSKGVFRGDRLRCPWHGACFNVKTGDIEEYPALDCLPRFKVTVEDGKVFVTAKKKVPTLPAATKHNQQLGLDMRCLLNPDTVLLLGAGVAALVCAETLRQEGFTGRIIMATKDKHGPYDKAKLSKKMNLKAEDIYLRTSEFLDARGIELWTEREAVSVDFQRQKVSFMNGSSQKYNHLLIATGSHPIHLEVPGADLQNICLLQTPEDSNKILELATGKNLVIIGASFIGVRLGWISSRGETTETSLQPGAAAKLPAWVLPGYCCFTSLDFLSECSYQLPLPFQMLQNKGVKFYMKTKLSELKGRDGKVTEAVLDSGKKIPADVVVAGIGVSPSSAFLKGTSIARNSSGAILVDLRMQTNIPNVFAAGDVVSFPVALLNGEQLSIHHQQVAEAHGHIAALNMLKKQKELHTVPFFWTTMLGESIRYAGCGEGYTDTVVKGSLEQLKFLIFYIKDGYVVAAASLNCDPMVSLIAEVLYSGKQISKEEAE